MLTTATAPSYASRVALVIGNAAYQHVPELANPGNDANDIAAKLESLGFDVVKGTDLELEGMRRSVRTFISKLKGAEIAVFYYAGHGLQVEGKNYIAPTDARLASYDDLEFEAMKIDVVLAAMERNTDTNLVFLDACRDNPLAVNLARSMGTRSSAVGRGLAQIGSGVGSLISFATQPGNVALDGDGRNSPYTAALLEHLGRPGEGIAQNLIRVRRAVLRATGGQQVPWENSSLTGSVVLQPAPESPSEQSQTGPVDERALEFALWSQIEEANDPDLIRDFIAKFPDGLFNKVATRRLQALEGSVDQDEPAGQQQASLADEGKSRPAAERKPFSLDNCVGCADELTVVSWGGVYTKSQVNAYHQPYSQATGVSVRSVDDAYEAIPRIRTMVESGAHEWDVVDVVADDGLRLCEAGLVEPIVFETELAYAPDGRSPGDDFSIKLSTDCYVPQIVWSDVLAYNTNAPGWNGRKPDSVCALFDTARFPGKRSLGERPLPNLYWALICDGVRPDAVLGMLETDAGLERALAKLQTIRGDIMWWSAGAQSIYNLSEEGAVMGSSYNGRVFNAVEEDDLPLAEIWDGQVLDSDGWVIPKGLPPERLARAKHFVHFATDTKRLADQAAWIAYGPARKSSLDLVPRHAEFGVDMRGRLPTSPGNMRRSIYRDPLWSARHLQRLLERFTQWREG